MPDLLKLNLGSGTNRVAGYVSVDKFRECAPDVVQDLERFPWPWVTSSVSHVLMSHSLEHIGQDSGIFLQFMQELYRVCAHDAEIFIVVPHPNHRDFQNDPTHVRPITPSVLDLFSQKRNLEFEQNRWANSQLARYTNTDFEVVSVKTVLESKWQQRLDSGAMSVDDMLAAVEEKLNVAKEFQITLRVIKP